MLIAEATKLLNEYVEGYLNKCWPDQFILERILCLELGFSLIFNDVKSQKSFSAGIVTNALAHQVLVEKSNESLTELHDMLGAVLMKNKYAG